MKSLLLTLTLIFFSVKSFAQEYVVFNDVWTGTGSTTSISIDNISQVTGSGFRIFSIGSTFPTTGNDVPSTLTYSNNGVLFSKTGIVKGKFGNQNSPDGLYFLANDNSAYILVLPLKENQFTAGTSPRGNSSGIVDDVLSLKSSQSASVIMNLTNSAPEIESSTAYSEFILTFTQNRSASDKNISFTPTLINSTALSGSDFGTGIEYRKTLSDSWASATSGISVGYTDNTIYLRVPLLNDLTPECQEQFLLQTGVLTGTGAIEVQNYEGVYGIGKISDDNDVLTWTGATSTDWDVSSNYDLSLAPDSCYCISLPTAPSGGRDPIISSSSTKNTLKNLTINSGGKISIGSGATLKVIGDVSINNAVDGVTGDGTLELNGTTSQKITGNGLVKNIKINNSAGVVIEAGETNKLNVLGALSVSVGTITTNDNLIFKATSTEEGVVGTISTCPTDPFIGNVTVERYIPATARSLRFITPGVISSSFTVNQNWQEGVNETNRFNYGSGAVNPKNPNPGYGTHITGSMTGLNGLDATITGNPSMYAFENRTTGYGWQTITNTDTTKFRRPGQAFAIMIRGDRSIDLTSNTPTPTSTILRTKGRLTNCNYSFSSDVNSLVPISSTADTYSFIGNPYWSIVNWSRVSRTNIDNRIYYFDPAITGTNSVGGYVTLSMVNEANDGEDQKQFSGNGVGRVSRYLQPGQGFFIRNGPSGNLPVVSFEEADKENSTARKFSLFSKNPSGNINEGGSFDNTRVRSSNKYEKIFVSLYLNKNINKAPADGFLISYNNNFSDSYSLEDAPKLSNQDENMFVDFAGRRLAILGLKSGIDLKSDTIPVSFTNLYDQDYIIHFDFTDNVDPQREIFLINKATGARQKINDGQVFDFAFRPQPGIRTNSDYIIVVNSKKIESKGRVRKSIAVITNPITNGVLQFSVPGESVNNESKGNIQVNIFDLSGRLLLTKTLQKSMNIYESVNVDNLRAGSYLLKIMHGDEVHTKKIIKQ